MEEKNVAIFHNTTIIKIITIIIMGLCSCFFDFKGLNIIAIIPFFSFCFLNGINYFLLSILALLIGNALNYNSFSFYVLIGLSIYILLYYIFNILKVKTKINHFLSSVFSTFLTYLVFFFLEKNMVLLDLALLCCLSALISFFFSTIIDIYVNKIIYFKSENHLLIFSVLFSLYLSFCPITDLGIILIGCFIIILAIKSKLVYILSAICSLYIFLYILNNPLMDKLIFITIPALFISFFNDSKKYSCCLVYLVISYLITFITENKIESFLLINGSCLLFLFLLPKSFFNKITKTEYYYDIYLAHKKMLYQQLEQFSQLFLSVSKLFSDSKTSRILAKANVEVFDKLCASCPKKRECHQKNKSLLLSYFKDGLLNKLNKEKKQYILDNCLKADAYFLLIENFLHTKLIKYFEDDEVCHIKDIVSEQFTSFSKIIDLYKNNLLKDRLLISANFYHDIKLGLDAYDYDVLYVNNYSNSNIYKFDIAISNIKVEEINNLIIPIINDILSVRIKVDNISQNTLLSNYLIISISEIKNNNLEFAFKQNSKDIFVCGDYISHMEDEQRFCLGLSDGMGNGMEANEESVFTLNVLFNTIKSHMDINEGINITNSLLKLKNDYDTYTTLDLVDIDKVTLTAKFYKAGATYSFIIRNNEVNVIENYSYPLGIIQTTFVDPRIINLQTNDIILMLSDGLIDEFSEEIKEIFLLHQNETNAKVLARELFEQLIEIKQNKDDASLAVIIIK